MSSLNRSRGKTLSRTSRGRPSSPAAIRHPRRTDSLERRTYTRSRHNPTSFTVWIRAVTAGIPVRFCFTLTYVCVSAHWL
ncbi:hypothetical protein AArc1_1211 [Natrarchaeobaculum sulfurireducens]|uniref:Uncharacterized protein n=1 Tax=Natrarchaeobaculum sulfurireducens TaxID=2044521 RepID=A0A346PDF6_9EURY|nr:hypothetical protein AArc1_1211 [Natrarchaeobaculum sulfurireducens]